MPRTALHKKKLREKRIKARQRDRAKAVQLLELLNNHVPALEIRLDLAPIFAELRRAMFERRKRSSNAPS